MMNSQICYFSLTFLNIPHENENKLSQIWDWAKLLDQPLITAYFLIKVHILIENSIDIPYREIENIEAMTMFLSSSCLMQTTKV